jgi:hypothetical protein
VQAQEGVKLLEATTKFEEVVAIVNEMTRHLERREKNLVLLEKIDAPIVSFLFLKTLLFKRDVC